MSEVGSELSPREQALLLELGRRLEEHLPTLAAGWDRALDDLLAAGGGPAQQGLRQESLSAAYTLLNALSSGRPADAWEGGRAYGSTMAMQGLSHKLLGSWLAALRQSLFTVLTQAYADDPQLDQAIIALSKLYALYMLQVGESFSGRQQSLLLEQQEALRHAYEEAQRRVVELEVLNEVGRAIGSTIELEDLLQLIYHQTSRLMDTANFFIALCDWERGLLNFEIEMEEGAGLPGGSMPIDQGLSGYIARSGQPLLLPHGPDEFLEQQGIPRVGRPAMSWLGVPMIAQDKVVGVLAVQSYSQDGAHDEGHLRVLSAIATQAAVAVQNARLYREARRRAEELEVLYRLGATAALRLSLEEILQSIYDQASVVMDTTAFFVALYDRETDEIAFEMVHDKDGREASTRTKKSERGGLTGWVLDHGETLLIRDWEHEAPAELRQIAVQDGEPVLSWLGVPMIIRSETIGVITAQSYQPNAFDEHHRQVLEMIAHQAAAAVENARLFAETRRRLEEVAALNEVSRAISSTMELDNLLELIYQQTGRLMDTTSFYIALCDWERKQLHFVLRYEEGQRIPPQTRQITSGLTGHIARTGQPLLFPHGPDEFLDSQGITRVGRASESWLGVPMIVQDRVVGVITVQSYAQEGAYDEGHQGVLSTIATQAAVAVENARLYEEARRRIEEMEALYRIGTASASRLTFEEIFESIYAQASVVMDTSAFYVALYDRETDEIRADLIYDQGERMPPYRTRKSERGGAIGWIVDRGESLLLQDWEQDAPEDLRRVALDMEEKPVRSWLSVPLIARGEVIGIITSQSYEAGAFEEHDQQVLEMIAHQAAPALSNASLYQEAQLRVAQLSALQQIGLKLAATAELSEVLDAVAASAIELLHANDVLIFLYDAAEDSFTLGCGLRDSGERGLFVPMPRKDGLTAQVAHSGEMAVIEDATEHPLYAEQIEQARGLRSIASMPLTRAGQVLGVLNVSYYDLHHFSGEETRLLQAFADQAAVAVGNVRLFQQMQAVMQELQETAETQSTLLNLIQDLSTPIVPLLRGVLLMPLVGSIDSERGRQMLERLLRAVELRRAQIVLLDITGVPVVDTAVAQILLQAVQAAQLLGSEAVLVGIRPEVAQTLVGLGVDLAGITTRSDLQGGLLYAMRRAGQKQLWKMGSPPGGLG